MCAIAQRFEGKGSFSWAVPILHQNGNVTDASAKFLCERVESLLDYLDEVLTLHLSPG
jgi:hypothetical protein